MHRHRPRSKTGEAFWICSGTSEFQREARLLAGRLGELAEEFALAFGVHPMLAVKAIVKPARPGSHPELLQRFLQVHDNLAAVGESQCDHAAYALVVNVCVRGVVDAITGALYSAQSGFRVVQVFVVVHYNAIMINTHRILGALSVPTRPLVLAALMGVGLLVVGCGQKGPLYLPTDAGVQAKPAKPAIRDDGEVKDQPAR